jgi:hypothetical protein
LKFTIVLLIRNGLLLLLLLIVNKAGTIDDDTLFIFDGLVSPVSPVWGWQGIPVRNLNAALNTVERN